MKITITATDLLVSQTDLNREFIPRLVRIWDGITEQGVACKVLVCGVAVSNSENQSQFDREMKEIPLGKKVIDLRHIL